LVTSLIIAGGPFDLFRDPSFKPEYPGLASHSRAGWTLQIILHIAPRLINRKNSLKSQPTKGMRPSSVMRIVPTRKGQKNEVVRGFLLPLNLVQQCNISNRSQEGVGNVFLFLREVIRDFCEKLFHFLVSFKYQILREAS